MCSTFTTRTVAFHKYRIMEVLNAKSNAELVQGVCNQAPLDCCLASDYGSELLTQVT